MMNRRNFLVLAATAPVVGAGVAEVAPVASEFSNLVSTPITREVTYATYARLKHISIAGVDIQFTEGTWCQ